MDSKTTLAAPTTAQGLIRQLDKLHGNHQIFCLAEQQNTAFPSFTSGSIKLDLMLGCNGYPYGKIIEIYGPDGCGKTTLALHAVASVQLQGKIAAYIDVEHALNPHYAKQIGVKLNELIFCQPDSGEDAIAIMEDLIKSNQVKLIVLDSVATLVSKLELEASAPVNEAPIALQARMMSSALKRLNPLAAQYQCCLIFINQLREKVGQFFAGNNEVTSGGRALKYYSSIRLDVRRDKQIKHNNLILGHQLRLKTIKNKFANPFQVIELVLFYGKGIVFEYELATLGLQKQLIIQKGAWFYFQEQKLGQGLDNVVNFLQTNLELRTKILEAVYLSFQSVNPKQAEKTEKTELAL